MSEKREWIGENGYCNCLLVVMFRALVPEIKLNQEESPINLEQIALGNPETLEWLKTQDFDYNELDTAKIIEILIESADMRGGFFGKKNGLINAVIVGNDGVRKNNEFKLKLQKEKNTKILHIKL
jgi:hypothetical protein